MQSLAFPASVTKRKQACKSCRQRKKRCDSERPTCGLCKKWGLRCEYTVPASSRLDDNAPFYPMAETLFGAHRNTPLEFERNGAPDFMQVPSMSFNMPAPDAEAFASVQTGYETPSGANATQATSGAAFDPDFSIDMGLPDDDVLFELIRIFFDRFYYMFPCFHKAAFMAELQNRHLQTQAPILPYAMCCLASQFHPDPAIKSRRSDWYEQAKFLYDVTGRFPLPALRTIQAVLCLLVHASTEGDFSASWLYLGKAWRQAVALGMHRMDSSHAVMMGLNPADAHAEDETVFTLQKLAAKTAVEKEEYRRTLWLLFMLDRNGSWPTGWPNAIDDRNFKVDIPLADSVFQAMDPGIEVSPFSNTPFTRDLNGLIASSSSGRDPLNLFHYLAIAHVLLGRVAELLYSLHDPPHTPEYADKCNELDSYIVKFRLSLPRSATSVLEASPDDRGYVLWLNIVLNTMAILLHYRCATFVSPAAASTLFTRTLVAAQNTAQIVKDTARISIDLLLNANLGPSLYMSACVLVIHWRITDAPTLKDDIDLFALVFERMNDVYSFLGLKFKLGLEHDLKRSKESVVDLRERGFKGLLADCSKWMFIEREAAKIGYTIT